MEIYGFIGVTLSKKSAHIIPIFKEKWNIFVYFFDKTQ